MVTQDISRVSCQKGPYPPCVRMAARALFGRIPSIYVICHKAYHTFITPSMLLHDILWCRRWWWNRPPDHHCISASLLHVCLTHALIVDLSDKMLFINESEIDLKYSQSIILLFENPKEITIAQNVVHVESHDWMVGYIHQGNTNMPITMTQKIH